MKQVLILLSLFLGRILKRFPVYIVADFNFFFNRGVYLSCRLHKCLRMQIFLYVDIFSKITCIELNTCWVLYR